MQTVLSLKLFTFYGETWDRILMRMVAENISNLWNIVTLTQFNN